MVLYDVYSVSPKGALALNVQADLLDNLGTCVFAQLLPRSEAPTPLKDLNPTFDIAGNQYAVTTQAIVAVPVNLLRAAVVLLGDH